MYGWVHIGAWALVGTNMALCEVWWHIFLQCMERFIAVYLLFCHLLVIGVQWQNWHILLSLLPFIALQHSCSPIHVFYISGMTSQLGLLYCCTVHHCWHWTPGIELELGPIILSKWVDRLLTITILVLAIDSNPSLMQFRFILYTNCGTNCIFYPSYLACLCVCVYACVRAKQNKHPGIHWDKHTCSTVIWLIMWYYTDIPIMHCVLS